MASTHRSHLVLRSSTVVAGCVLLCWGTWVLVRTPLLALAEPLVRATGRGSGPVPAQTAIVGLCAAVLLACVLWVSGLFLLSVAGVLARRLAPGSAAVHRLVRRVERLSPALVRRSVTTLLGVTLGAGLVLPALATPHPPPGPVTLSGLRLPDRATGTGLATTARTDFHRQPRSRSARRHRDYVEVRSGDSLWRIAQSLLGPGADDVEITRAWQGIQRANADRIGADPDLIHPGTRLTVPQRLTPRLSDRKDPS
jgi:hypothetical protein